MPDARILLRSPLLAAAAPALLAACLCLWAVDVLNWDEWMIWTGVLAKLKAGGLSWHDLITQQNEQRNLAARLSGLALMPAFRLWRLPECTVSVGIAAIGFFSALSVYSSTGRLIAASAAPHSPAALRPAPVAAISLLVFSLQQWETFSVGINSSVALPPAALWLGAALATRRADGKGLGWAGLVGMVAAGLIPSFSFVNGLFYWPCLLPLVWLFAQRSRKAKTCAFACAGVLMWLAYFHGYSPSPHHPSPLASLARPDKLTAFFLAYLGGSLTVDRNLLPLAIPAGLAGLCMLLAVPLALLRTPGSRHSALERLRPISPWLAVANFALLSALATAAGRSGLGLEQALESRYATFSAPLWIAMFCMHAQHGGVLSPRTRVWSDRAQAFCAGLFVLSAVLAGIVLHNRAPLLREARQELYSLTRPERLREVFPEPAWVIRALPLYLELRQAMYRDLRPLGDYPSQTAPAGAFALASGPDATGRLCGWLFTGRVDPAARWVVLAQETRALAAAKAGPDGAFSLFVPDNALPEGDLRLTAMAVMPGRGGDSLAPLSPSAGLTVFNAQCPTPTITVEKYFHVR